MWWMKFSGGRNEPGNTKVKTEIQWKIENDNK